MYCRCGKCTIFFKIVFKQSSFLHGKQALGGVHISEFYCTPALLPSQQRWCGKWKLSWNVYTLHASFCTSGTDTYAQSTLINNISASELRRKFIKSALLVGYVLAGHPKLSLATTTETFFYPFLPPLPPPQDNHKLLSLAAVLLSFPF